MFRSLSRFRTSPSLTSRQVHSMSWRAHLPTPKSSPGDISVEELAQLIDTAKLGEDYIIVDVRRTDIDEPEAGTLIPTAINLPAQTFYPTLPASTALLRKIPKVVFHCNSCSNNGRGPTAAGWYQDYLDEKHEEQSKAYVLKGGFKAWKAAYPDKLVRV